MSAPDQITTVISDFGGVLTTPLVQSFAAVQDETGIPFEELGKAMAEIERVDGEHPLYELEKGQPDRGGVPRQARRRARARARASARAAPLPGDLLRRPASEPADDRPDARGQGPGAPDGAAHQQRPGGAAVAFDAPGRRDLRACGRLRLRRLPEPDREIYDSPSTGLAAPNPVNACSSTTPTSTARRRRSSG